MPVPRVSVVMPVYEGEPYVGQAVTSVLRQTISDLELIVCDNASTDDTLRTVERLNDGRISVLESDTNTGPAANWNRALASATAPYVKLMCAHDLLATTWLERAGRLSGGFGDGVLLVTCLREVIDASGRRRSRPCPPSRTPGGYGAEPSG